MGSFRGVLLFLALMFGAFIATAGEMIDINTADAQALAALQGVGPQKAEAIVAYRQEHGPFKSVDDLANVKGIGQKTVDANRDKIAVGAKPNKPAK